MIFEQWWEKHGQYLGSFKSDLHIAWEAGREAMAFNALENCRHIEMAGIRVTAKIGSSISKCLIEAADVAVKRGLPVSFDFNGTDYVERPSEIKEVGAQNE